MTNFAPQPPQTTQTRRRWLATAGAALLAMAAASSPAMAAGRGKGAPNRSAKLRPLILYGSSHCGICESFRRNLAVRQRGYEFRDIKKSEADHEAMWALARKAKPGQSSVRLPIVVYGDDVLVSPTWRELEAKLDAAEPRGAGSRRLPGGVGSSGNRR